MSEVEAGAEAPENDATVAEEAQASEEVSTPQPEPEKPDRVQKRINQLTWEKHEAQRKNAELEERLKALENRQPSAAEAVQGLEAPKFSDFDTDEAYAQALTNHNMQMFEKMQEQSQQHAEAARRQAEREQKVNSYQERMAAYVAEHDEALEAITGSNINVSPGVEQVLLDSDKGPELTHWLAENPAEAIRINQLPEVLAAKELGRIEATFDAVAPKKVSEAPPPQTDLSGGDAEEPGSLRDDMDIDDWMAKRRAQVKEKYGRL